MDSIVEQQELHSAENGESMVENKKRLRILCLHGYKQNGTIFKSKTAVLRKSMKDIADFIYIDAPHVVDESKSTCSWWRCSKDGREYRGWEQTMDFLQNVFVTQGPFDGVLGFSQGAVLCSLLCSISSLNSDQHSLESNPINLKFGLLFSGFQSRATIHQNYYPSSTEQVDGSPSTNSPSSSSYPFNKISVPSLHVWGKTDELVANSNCQCLSSQFSDPQVYIHEYGHLIPTCKIDIQNYRNFLTTFLKDVQLK